MKTKVWKTMSVLFFTFFVLSGANLVRATPTLAPTSTIPSVSGNLAYDSGKGEIFAQYGSPNGQVAVISDATNQVVATITEQQTNGYNGELAYDSGKGEIFAASGYAKQGFPPVITVISDSDNTIVTTISAASPGNSAYNWPNEPYGLVYDIAKGEIFVSDPSAHSGSVYVISDSPNAVVATVGVGANPNGMVYDSGMGEIFVVNTGSGTISVISDNSNAVVATITVPVAQIAYDSGKNEVFAYGGSGTVSVISDSTNQVVATVTGITSGLTAMAYDSAKGEIFVGDQVISDSSNTIVAQLPTNLNGEAVYDSGKGEVFGVTNVGLSVFSGSSNPSASSVSSSSPSPATTSPSPSVPEFGNAGLTLVAAMLMIVTASMVAFAVKRKKQNMQ